VMFTHAHFDHTFGAEAFGECDIWAHPGCRTALVERGEEQRSQWAAQYPIETARIVLPDRLVEETTIDLGGRVVRLFHPGRGHTDHDLAVYVPDARVLFAGDLVEQGAPPSFDDSDPLAWPDAVSRLLDTDPAVVVPGHGDPVDADFVRTQREELAAVAELCAAVWDGGLSAEAALARSPYPANYTKDALSRRAEPTR
jgi:glyoxylase-like metal-dependent hydrolase (beta-lactamase superfamily II)